MLGVAGGGNTLTRSSSGAAAPVPPAREAIDDERERAADEERVAEQERERALLQEAATPVPEVPSLAQVGGHGEVRLELELGVEPQIDEGISERHGAEHEPEPHERAHGVHTDLRSKT